MKNNYKVLEQSINYTFKNKELIIQALTHSSETKTNNYERLEFLGDSLLSVIVAEHLYLTSNKKVGDMSVLRSRLVSTDALSNIVLKNNWQNLINVGPSIKNVNNIAKNILADIFESIVAAIYLDAGIEKTKQFVANYVLSQIESVVNSDYKTALQEKVASINNLATLQYKLLESEGPSHNMKFTVGLYYNNKLVAKAEGKSKKSAEQTCAKMLLEKINNGSI